VLVNITGNKNTSMMEVREAMNLIKESVSQEAHIFYGQVIDPNLEDRIKVTVIATGFPAKRAVSNKSVRHMGRIDEVNSSVDYTKPAYTHWQIKKLK